MEGAGLSNTAEKSDRFKFFRDPVYGYVVLPEDVVRTIVDDPVFQRLRDIRQNGLAHFVYPHLEHSRFSHSLGVAQAIQESLKYVALNTRLYVLPSTRGDERRKIECVLCLLESDVVRKHALALALLHDIGHMPYSHVYEYAIEDLVNVFNDDIVAEVEKYRRHDEAEVFIKLLNMLLKDSRTIDSQLLVALLTLTYTPSSVMEKRFVEYRDVLMKLAESCSDACSDESIKEYSIVTVMRLLRDLINSNIDVDRADYMVRDSIAAGVRYGLFDIERLFSVMILAPPPNIKTAFRRPVLGILDKGVSVVESMLISRSYMYSEVYLHRIALAFNSMLARFISLLLYLALQAKRLGVNLGPLRILNPEITIKRKESWVRSTDSYVNTLIAQCNCLLEWEESPLETVFREFFQRVDDKIRFVELCASAVFLSHLIMHRKVPTLWICLENERQVYKSAIDHYDEIVAVMRNSPVLILSTVPMLYNTNFEGEPIYRTERDVPVIVRGEDKWLIRFLRDVGYLIARLAETKFFRVIAVTPVIDLKGLKNDENEKETVLDKLRSKNVQCKHCSEQHVKSYTNLFTKALEACTDIVGASSEKTIQDIVSKVQKDAVKLLEAVFLQ